LAELGDASHQLLVTLLREHQQGHVAAELVVVDDHADRGRRVADRRTAFVGHRLLGALERRLLQAAPAAEVPEHGLHAHAGPAGDVVEPDVGDGTLAVQGYTGVDDPGPGLLDGTGPGGHGVRAGGVHVNDTSHQSRFDVNTYS